MNWHQGKCALAHAIHLDLTHNQEHYAEALRRFVQPSIKWLDIGCGHSIVPDWAMPPEEQQRMVRRTAFVVGVDVDDGIVRHPLLTYKVKALGGRLPFRDGSFDLVTANMVVEHVADSDEFLDDVYRVLRPGGHFLFVTPNRLSPLMYVGQHIPDALKKFVVGFLEKRREEDVFPALYRMNDPGAIERSAQHAGFETEKLQMIGSSGEFDRLGPLSWLECFLLKAIAGPLHGKLQPDVLAVLKRTA